MKKILLIFFSPLFCVCVGAQITVTNVSFPVAGDKLRLAIDYYPAGIESTVGPPGGPQTWDLSQLQVDAVQEISYKPASEGSASVPGASLFAQLDATTEGYYAVSTSKFDEVAQYGIQPLINSQDLIKFLPARTERRSPLNFFDINQQSSSYAKAYASAQLAPNIRQLIPGTENGQIDSVRQRVSWLQVEVVDAYGTMTIPNGSFQVLREKKVTYNTSQIDVHTFLGWIQLINYTVGLPQGTDTTLQYYFYGNDAKEPIAIILLNNEQDTIVQATYKNIVVCNAPTGLSASRINTTSAQLNWAAESAAAKYMIQYQAKGDAVWLTKKVQSPAVLAHLKNLLPGTTYKWRIKTDCNGGSSGYSPIQSFKTDRALPNTLHAIAASPPAQGLKVYPNPAQRAFTIDLKLSNTPTGKAQVEIINGMGKTVYTTTADLYKGELKKQLIPATKLADGYYLVSILLNNKTYTARLIIHQ